MVQGESIVSDHDIGGCADAQEKFKRDIMDKGRVVLALVGQCLKSLLAELGSSWLILSPSLSLLVLWQ